MDNQATEIIRWSRGSMFTIEPEWLSDELLKAVYAKFKFDFEKYYPGEAIDLDQVKYFPGLFCTLLYRISREYFLRGQERIALEFSTWARYATGIELFYSADIGAGLRINHGSGLVVGARTKLGINCLLHQNITIGDRNGGRPVIGDNVKIYTGSSILGPITIGNDVTIGAHTLVYRSVPDHKIVVGNPNQIKDAKP